MTNRNKIIVLVAVEIVLTGLIISLGYKIITLTRSKQGSGQFVTTINKNDVLGSSDEGLSYFFEPKPNTISSDKPDWLGYEVTNTINSDTLNERYEYQIQKPQNTYRIITLGDSFTYGQYVPTDKNYSEVLEDLLNKNVKCHDIEKFEVINLGVYSYDIDYSLSRFSKRGTKYDPDLVLWMLNEWNFRVNELVYPERDKLIANGVPAYDSKNKIYKAQTGAEKIVFRKFGKKYINDYQKKVMFSMNKYYTNKLIILSFKNMKDDYKEIIEKFIKPNSNYSFYDKLPAIWTNDLGLEDGHPSIKGHELIANDVLKYLNSNILTSCSYQR